MKNIMGINLSPSVEKLLTEVELGFAKQVRFQISNNPHAHAECVVIDGEPIIGMKRGPNEYDIAHELCHLRCRLRGLPLTITLHTSRDQEGTSYLCSQIHSTIEHLIIYPELIELGLDPFKDVNNSILASGFHKDIAFSNNDDPASMVCLYIRAMLECNDPLLKKGVDDRFKKYARNERTLAKQIMRNIGRYDLTKKSDYIAALTETLRKFKLTEKDWSLEYC